MLNKAIINLGVIRENAKTVKSILKKGTRFCAVVKADAYGHGAEKVAAALYNIVDCYAVALVEEGVALRLSGIDKEILVLTRAALQDIAVAARFDLTLTATGIQDLKVFERAANFSDATVKTHIKYDTGMNRQGVKGIENLKKTLDFANKLKHVCVTGFYSHYATPENDAERNSATDKFLLANNLIKSYNKNVVRHISASGGAIKGEFFDMVRIGILLYGYKPFDCDIAVRPAMKIYAPVVESRVLKKGEGALYGLKRANAKTRVSLVRYGYADGLFRRECGDLFNNRCMDVSAYLGYKKREKFACVMDDAERIAEACGTISYEILTKAAVRAEKIYID